MKNFSLLTLGTLISQAIGFIGFVYLARFLGSEYYGIYVTVGAFMGMFQLLTFTGLKKVIVRKCSKNVEKASEIYNQTIGLQSLFVFIAIIAMLISSFFTNYETSTILFIAIYSLKLFSTSFRGYIGTVYRYSEKMEYLAGFQILNRILFVVLSISFLLLGYGLFAVVLISVGTSVFDVILRFYYSKKIVSFNIFSKLKFNKKIIKPSIIFSAMGIVGRLHSRVDLFMISLLGSPTEVAIYGIAYKLAREADTLRNLLADAFFPVAVKTLHGGTINKKVIIKYSFFFGIGMLFLAVVGFFVAEPAITLLFGEEYTESGPILKVLIFYMIAWFSTLPFTESVQATGNEKVILIGKGAMATINIPLNLILYWTYGLIGIAYSTLIVYTIGSLTINIYSYYLLKKQGYIK
ncbi:MAG: flippase [Nanoarchaeota archaeon]